jgi:hypothetical protein
VAGRANVADTPELLAYYDELDRLEAGALWTVGNKIEPWEPQSQSQPVLWRYTDLRDHVLKSLELVSPEKAGRRVIFLSNPGRRDVSAAVGWLPASSLSTTCRSCEHWACIARKPSAITMDISRWLSSSRVTAGGYSGEWRMAIGLGSFVPVPVMPQRRFNHREQT